VRDQIAKILNPNFAGGAPASGGGTRSAFDDLLLRAPDVCWPDYVIRP